MGGVLKHKSECFYKLTKLVTEVKIAAELKYLISFDATATIFAKIDIFAAIVNNFILTAQGIPPGCPLKLCQ